MGHGTESINWKTIATRAFQILHFTANELLLPEYLRDLDVPRLDRSKGVVLSGRGPVWLFGYLVHLCHPHPFVATYDPRFQGAVVVERHHPNAPQVGEIIPLAEWASTLDR
ncbi:MAG: CRISPR-associated protein Csx3 [Deltaproteobacteria bacterium]|nr:CRISPR-associated protein Csx3 [Deltaproteobacteria bacterium]